jgi:ferric iron reductase protein FhuF
MGGDHDVVEPDLEALATAGAFDPDALGTLGMTLTTGPPTGDRWELPVAAMLEDGLEERVEALAARLGEVPDPVVGASWSKHVSTVIAPGILAAWTLADVGLDASPANLALHLEGPEPRRCRILDPGKVDRGRPERQRSLATLMGDTLEPLFAAIERVTDVSDPIQWSNVGNLTTFLYDELDRRGIAAGGLAADRERLLNREAAAWREGPNPLQDTVGYERFEDPGLPDRYQVRRVCCLKRAIPDAQACASCPELSHDQRRERLADRGHPS